MWRLPRAEKNVTISFARSRFKYGEHSFVTASRFLKDIDVAFIEDGGLPPPLAKVEVSKKPSRSKTGL
jgi:DNA helicase II / ATP-dependent DNA helicase PcrA